MGEPEDKVLPASSGTALAMSSPLGAGGLAFLASSNHLRAVSASGAWTAREGARTHDVARLQEEVAPDPNLPWRKVAEDQFFGQMEKERVTSSRRAYPRKKVKETVEVDPLTGEETGTTTRRVMGFGLGFEKVFATTSIKLPISAYTTFVELHIAHSKEVYSRCFNGMHTLFDLKKWIFEKMLIPSNSYDLSYAEPGKVALNDQMRLLTTQESLEVRTFAAPRAVRGMYRGIPGVHSIDDLGVTRLYLRLKCRTCGNVLNSLQTCQRMRRFGARDAIPDSSTFPTSPPAIVDEAEDGPHEDPSQAEPEPTYKAGVPGLDPNIEDLWYRPDERKHCLYHGRGFEYFEAARTHGGAAEVARIYISCGKEPSKKLRLSDNPVASRNGPVKISY